MKFRRIAALLAAVAFTMSASLPLGSLQASAASSSNIQSKINDLEKQLKDLSAQKQKLQKSYNGVTNKKAEQQKLKKTIDSQVDVLKNQISVSNQILKELNSQIAEKEKEAGSLQSQTDQKYELFKKRVRASYEEGSVSILSVFFASDRFSDMLMQIDVIESILQFDNELITSLKNDRQQTLEVKSQIEADKKKQQEVKSGLVGTQNELEDKLDESEELISQLSGDQEKYRQQLIAIDKAEEKIDKEIQKQLAELAKKNATYVGGDFTWPTPGYTTITSSFGMRYHPVLKKNKLHTGVDIAAAGGTPIHAANSGTVVTSKYSEAYGNYIIIDHGGGKATLYAHMSSLSSFGAGAKVKKDDIIGKVGSTGWSTGYHLHFEIRINGTAVNPMNYFS